MALAQRLVQNPQCSAHLNLLFSACDLRMTEVGETRWILLRWSRR